MTFNFRKIIVWYCKVIISPKKSFKRVYLFKHTTFYGKAQITYTTAFNIIKYSKGICKLDCLDYDFYFYEKKLFASYLDYFDVSWNSAKVLLFATIVTIRNSPMNPHRRFISKENIFHHNFVILKVREGRRIPCVYPREISFVPCRYCILFTGSCESSFTWIMGKN